MKTNVIDNIYNNTVTAYAISAAWELGLLERLEASEQPVNLAEFAAEQDLDSPSVEAVTRGLALAEVVHLAADRRTAVRGPQFAETWAKKGFFYWLTRGCGDLFRTMPELVRNERRTGDYVTRDYKAIGLAARDAGFSYVDPTFYKIIADRGLSVGADLGCGSGERLIKLAGRDPEFRGIGVDIAPGALALAKASVDEAGLADRLSVVHGDATRMEFRPEFADVEFVCTFMMGHDLWPREECLNSLKLIGEAFPKATDLIVCDTYRSDLAPTEQHPVFTLGFETAHAVMGQMLPSLGEWTEVLAEAGWRTADIIDFDLPPYTALMHLTREQAE
ncbi:Methyltransferase domain-containing protein [Actinokineospora alba]|uniref:Methyltransferase domain-containing protein n=1 Tax=Actinokineospora alba TaxID=504798 RepID=A0A1H0W246_9PSEU|nr:class I SAM-dependent methyltransferase [Actinokineospora alba]TDP67789.1 methyltransferase family protein [Actinokineospora alba]SDI71902.1 Methyltransferase domain-containing protein [Actinokineospora alba]SDP84787.1 Methyltransferase domain-containing protein [Actinokineospora alba]